MQPRDVTGHLAAFALGWKLFSVVGVFWCQIALLRDPRRPHAQLMSEWDGRDGAEKLAPPRPSLEEILRLADAWLER